MIIKLYFLDPCTQDGARLPIRDYGILQPLALGVQLYARSQHKIATMVYSFGSFNSLILELKWSFTFVKPWLLNFTSMDMLDRMNHNIAYFFSTLFFKGLVHLGLLHAPSTEFLHCNRLGSIIKYKQVSLTKNSQSRINSRQYYSFAFGSKTFHHWMINQTPKWKLIIC